MAAQLVLYGVLILVPTVLSILVFAVIPLAYVVLWARTFDRLGGKRALTLFGDLLVLLLLAWMISPPKIYLNPKGQRLICWRKWSCKRPPLIP